MIRSFVLLLIWYCLQVLAMNKTKRQRYKYLQARRHHPPSKNSITRRFFCTKPNLTQPFLRQPLPRPSHPPTFPSQRQRNFGNAGRFIGSSAFALKGDAFESDDGTLTNGYAYASWLFQWAFAATAATIVSGAVAERVAFNAYVIYSIVLTSFIYPVVVHWGWAGGFASAWVDNDLLFDCGVIDFAGSGVVHMTGGAAALCAAIVVGPRIGRFNENGTANTLPQQSAVLQVLFSLGGVVGWGLD